MIITTKYNIGDRVWIGMTRWTDKSVKCPECRYGYIEITLTTGEKALARCPRCYGRSYKSNFDFNPIVQQVTIGSVRYDSYAKEDERFSYMCVETGVGSGSIWYEPNIFCTKEEAEYHANVLTDKAKKDGLKERIAREERDKENYNSATPTIPAV